MLGAECSSCSFVLLSAWFSSTQCVMAFFLRAAGLTRYKRLTYLQATRWHKRVCRPIRITTGLHHVCRYMTHLQLLC